MASLLCVSYSRNSFTWIISFDPHHDLFEFFFFTNEFVEDFQGLSTESTLTLLEGHSVTKNSCAIILTFCSKSIL